MEINQIRKLIENSAQQFEQISGLDLTLQQDIQQWISMWKSKVFDLLNRYSTHLNAPKSANQSVIEIRRQLTFLWFEMESVWVQENNKANLLLENSPKLAELIGFKAFYLSLIMHSLSKVISENDVQHAGEEFKSLFQRSKLSV